MRTVVVHEDIDRDARVIERRESAGYRGLVRHIEYSLGDLVTLVSKRRRRRCQAIAIGAVQNQRRSSFGKPARDRVAEAA